MLYFLNEAADETLEFKCYADDKKLILHHFPVKSYVTEGYMFSFMPRFRVIPGP